MPENLKLLLVVCVCVCVDGSKVIDIYCNKILSVFIINPTIVLGYSSDRKSNKKMSKRLLEGMQWRRAIKGFDPGPVVDLIPILQVGSMQ
jgi:hypothetical protein